MTPKPQIPVPGSIPRMRIVYLLTYLIRVSRRSRTGMTKESLMVAGAMARVKPSFFASEMRWSGRKAERISPPRPTSPKTTYSSESLRPATALAMARQMARSAAESWSFSPPTTLTKMSWSESLSFVRRSRTAMRRFKRFRSQPEAVRFG